MFEAGVVRANELIIAPVTLCNMMVCCLFSLESPHLGDSNEYTQYTIFNIKNKIILYYSKSAAMGFFSRDSRTSSKQP